MPPGGGRSGASASPGSSRLASRSWRTIILVILIQYMVPILISSIVGGIIGFKASQQAQTKVRFKVFTEAIELINVFVLPLISIVPALLYLKMRQFGGETLNEVMSQLQDLDQAKSHWQQRMRSRLTVTPQARTPSGRASSFH